MININNEVNQIEYTTKEGNKIVWSLEDGRDLDEVIQEAASWIKSYEESLND